MIVNPARDEFRPVSIEAAIAAHGAWKVLIAAIAALLRGRMRKARPPDAAQLSPWMRADIGLPPVAAPPAWAGLPLAAVRLG